MAADTPPRGPDVLNGWKEIASYLKRSSRSVQRWERDLDLPIRRIPTPDGGAIVYALVADLEAWRQRQSDAFETQEPAAQDADASATSASEEIPALAAAKPLAAPWWERPIPLWAAIAATAVVALAVLAITTVVGYPLGGRPATWEFDGHQMTAYSTGGRRLWSHDFNRTVSTPMTFNRSNGFVGDANGDGAADLIVPVRYTSSQLLTTEESDAVVAFDADGRTLWSVQPDITLTAGDETFDGPWNVYDIVSGQSPRGPRVWIAFNHHTWWPGFVLEVTPAGDATVLMVQAARIHSLTHWPRPERPLLIAGGDLRDANGPQAGAIVVELSAPPVRWPGEGALSLTCADCPQGQPASVLLFPTSEVTRALLRPTGWVTRGKIEEDGLRLDVNDGFGFGTIVTLTADFAVAGYERTDRYWYVHRQLEQQGLVDHQAGDCPDLQGPMDVQQWRPDSGWQRQGVGLKISRPPRAD
ncbi:MAG: hypothetical protein IT178_19330 [Acidobacteria bacterium]|nr:hypothetical protein [Acidobacteriota bacterium]